MLAHALRLDPTNIFALYNRCVLRTMQGRLAKSVELCKRTLDIDPRYPGGLRQLGVDHLMLGDAPAGDRIVPGIDRCVAAFTLCFQGAQRPWGGRVGAGPAG